MAKLLLVIVPGSVEDERAFSTWGFIHNDWRNRLKPGHLNDCMRMFLQKWWDVDTFPYEAALDAWHKEDRRYAQSKRA